MAEDNKAKAFTEHEYGPGVLTTWFAWSSAALLVVSFWMIWADYARPWKSYQKEFRELEIKDLRDKVTSADKAIDAKALQELAAKRAAAQAEVDKNKAEVAKLQAERAKLEGRWYDADQTYKFAKADLDSVRYEVQEAQDHAAKDPGRLKKLEAVFTAKLAYVDGKRVAFEQVDAARNAIDAKITAITGVLEAADKERERLEADKAQWQRSLSHVDHTMVNNYLVRNFPLLDFLAPTVKVKQVVLPGLKEDVNFTTVDRADRCHTCHLGIDNKAYDKPETPKVFRAHSNHDTMLGVNHPIERFGCTGCHQGGGRSLEFFHASHTPSDDKQREAWEKSYDWERVEHWEYPMYPLRYTEANCANCHAQEQSVPHADKLNAGRKLLEESGCTGCHKVATRGYADLRKVGPDLSHIAAKVDHDWMFKWVKNPLEFNPATRMPRFFDLDNTSTPYWLERNNVEAEALVRYLRDKSKPYLGLAEPPGQGDVAKGQWVVTNRGCKACHVVGADDKGEGRPNAHFGPNLNQVGSKLTLTWIYNWVLNPKAMWPETQMPNLRLSEQEALDAAAYLLTLKNAGFESKALPPIKAEVLKGAAEEYLLKQYTKTEAAEKLSAMDDDQKYAYLGGKLVSRYGCFGCHPGIGGFEDAQRIGTELTTWSSKLITQLDFGFVDIEHTKEAFATQKLLHPRSYDKDKVESKHPQDLLKMPQFNFTPAQVDLLVTNVLSLQKDLATSEIHRHLDGDGAAIEKGRRLVRRFNCQGCHVVEGQGGGVVSVIEGGKALAPPVLHVTGGVEEGAKVQSDWLLKFLKKPTTVRPWINVRMPTFGFSDDEAASIVKYFNAMAKEPFPYQDVDLSNMDSALLAEGKQTFEKYQCVLCHQLPEDAAKVGKTAADLAPDLKLAKRRLNYRWIAKWLTNPGGIQPGTRMPNYFYYADDKGKLVPLTPTPAEAELKIHAVQNYLQFFGGDGASQMAQALPPARGQAKAEKR